MLRVKLALVAIAMTGWGGFASAQNSLAFYRADYETAVAGGINHLAAADFNGDGKLDVAIGYEGSGVSVSLGNGDGTFQPAQYFTETPAQNSCIGFGVLDIVAGDFNGDGHVDLVVANGQVLCLIPGNGDGTFGAPQTVLTGLDEELFGGFLATGDFNKDGNLDLVVLVGSGVTGEPQSTATVLLGHGNGAFTASDIFKVPTNQYASQVAVADFNGDGALDVAVTTLSWLLFGATQAPQTTFYVALGRGDGTFQSPITSPQTVTPDVRSLLVAADVNGDGKVDLVVAPTNSGLSIMLGNGDGTFGYPINEEWPLGFALAVADFDGDGKIDLALDYNGPGVATGVGDGTFSTPELVANFPQCLYVYSLLAVDINGDGKPDLIATTDIGLEIRINETTSTPAPFAVTSAASGITSAAPTSIAAMYGPTLASGTASAATLPLPITLAGSSVLVNDSLGVSRPAPLYYVSPTQINFEIPAGSAPGIATLEVDNGTTTLAGTAWILNTAPALFGSTAAYTITYGPDNQAQPPVPLQTCVASGCTVNPIEFPNGSQVFMVLYGTGIRNASVVTCVIDGQSFPVSFAGAQGVDEGLDQVNVEITSAMLFCGGGNCIDQIAVVTDGGISNPVGFW